MVSDSYFPINMEVYSITYFLVILFMYKLVQFNLLTLLIYGLWKMSEEAWI